jgi:hypothetical protein
LSAGVRFMTRAARPLAGKSPLNDAALGKPSCVCERVPGGALDAALEFQPIAFPLHGPSLKLLTASFLLKENLARSRTKALVVLQVKPVPPANIGIVDLAANRPEPALDRAFAPLEPAVAQAPVAVSLDTRSGGSADVAGPAKPEPGTESCHDRRGLSGCRCGCRRNRAVRGQLRDSHSSCTASGHDQQQCDGGNQKEPSSVSSFGCDLLWHAILHVQQAPFERNLALYDLGAAEGRTRRKRRFHVCARDGSCVFGSATAASLPELAERKIMKPSKDEGQDGTGEDTGR